MKKNKQSAFNSFDLILFILIAAAVAAAVFFAKRLITVSDGQDLTASFSARLTEDEAEYLAVGAEATAEGDNMFFGTVINYTETGDNEYIIYIDLTAEYKSGVGWECGGLRLAVGEKYDLCLGMLRLNAECTGFEQRPAQTGTQTEVQTQTEGTGNE